MKLLIWIKGLQEGEIKGRPRSARECERMNLHTPKATSTWGVGVPKDF